MLVFVIDSILNVAVNGVKTSRTQFCIGETFTLECIMPGIKYFIWEAPGLLRESTLSVTYQKEKLKYRHSLYTFMDTSGNSILRYTAGSQTNRTTLTCFNLRKSLALTKEIEILGMLTVK